MENSQVHVDLDLTGLSKRQESDAEINMRISAWIFA